jgi:flagellar hook protein FlgE
MTDVSSKIIASLPDQEEYMVRSLYAGISGLRNHQVSMDVIGNNIANVNTVGYKSGRVTFEESMSQLLQGASRPAGNAGGTNPLQVGLGMQIGSIDTILNQGNLQTTGQITDLAIEGKAYFAYNNSATGTYYSRNGALQLDGEGYLVSPTNGYRLQGMTAAVDGTFPAGTHIGDLRIPYGEKAPARATTEIRYTCNLDSESAGLGSVTHSNRFITQAASTDLLTSLFDRDGNDLGIQVGDEIIASVGGANSVRIPVTDTSTLTTLAADIQTYLRAQTGSGFITVNATNGNLVVDSTLDPATPINGLQITNSRPGSNSYVTGAFTFPPSIAGGSTYTVSGLRVPATANTLISNTFDSTGHTLGLETGDRLSINGSVGGENITTLSIPYADPADATSVYTMGDLVSRIQQAFRLPATDGTNYQNPSVSMNTTNTDDDQLPDGSIVIRGQPERAFSIGSVSISASNADNDATAPTYFNANLGFEEIQTARNTGVQSTSIVVYDESGDAHTITTTFTHSGQPNEWLWQITTEGGEEILSGNRGRITFGQDGSPSAFTFDDNSTGFRFDPMNGSNIVAVDLDVGTPGSFRGVTQFRSPSTTVARDQDGYPMGKLQEVSIDETGEIAGVYTNGVNKPIGRIFVAEFNNPAGLMKMGDSMYAESNNSGDAVLMRPGIGSASKIKPGALEMSNVELATEFTSMISTQRGFQANARVITTSDQMLQELVQLVR